MAAPEVLAHRDALYAKVDAFFARVAAKHPAELACGEGCADCCADDLTITRVEADAIETLLATLPPIAPGPRGACAALDAHGACRIYAARPLVCRTHGVVVKAVADDGARHLPVLPDATSLSVCPKNFKTTDLGTLDSSDILDQATLSSIIFALDRAFGNARMDRVGLRDLLERGIADAPPFSAR